MTRGRPLVYLVIALGLFVGAIGVLSVREYVPTLVVVPLVIGVFVVVSVLVAMGWRKR